LLGLILLGGRPTALEGVLGICLGLHAIVSVHEAYWGSLMALRGTDIVRVPLIEGTKELKTVPLERYTEAEVFFGS
jgi:6-phosphofructokinase 1